jgi:hypothetical protein
MAWRNPSAGLDEDPEPCVAGRWLRVGIIGGPDLRVGTFG